MTEGELNDLIFKYHYMMEQFAKNNVDTTNHEVRIPHKVFADLIYALKDQFASWLSVTTEIENLSDSIASKEEVVEGLTMALTIIENRMKGVKK